MKTDEIWGALSLKIFPKQSLASHQDEWRLQYPPVCVQKDKMKHASETERYRAI